MTKKKKFLSIISLIAIVLTIALLSTTMHAGSEIIRDETPGKYSGNGPYSYKSYRLPSSSTIGTSGATVYYPTNAKAPFSGLVYCPPFTTTESWLSAWGPFFASHGIVLVTFGTLTTMDQVDQRDNQQRTILDGLKKENTRYGSPLNGKLDTERIGAMGWSMGGGATWINAADYRGLKTAMTLAGHNLTAMDLNSKGYGIKCPTLIMNGATDLTYLGGMGQSLGVYNNIPGNVPKVIFEVASKGHMDWRTPTSAGRHVAEIALAFQKTYLDGDKRWAKYIERPSYDVSIWLSRNIY